MSQHDEYDPLAENDSAPAISWADVPVGTVQTIDVSKPCGKPIHYRDYDTKEPMYWQDNGRPSANVTDRPVEQIVFNGVDKNGEEAALFVKVKGEQLFYKLQAAQKVYGHRIGSGDTIDRVAIKLTGREHPDSGKKQNQFEVRITAAGPKAAPAPEADPFDDGDNSEPPF